jgi:hypothetical protein
MLSNGKKLIHFDWSIFICIDEKLKLAGLFELETQTKAT